MHVRIVVRQTDFGVRAGQPPVGLVVFLVRVMIVPGQQINAVRVHHLTLVNDRDGILGNEAGERQQRAHRTTKAKATRARSESGAPVSRRPYVERSSHMQ